MPDGKAEVTFDLSDSVTRFEVLVLSHTLDGRLGSNSVEITSKLPFSVEPKTPLEVTQKRSDRHPGRRHERACEEDLRATVGSRQGARPAGKRRAQPGARAEPDQAHHAARQADDQRWNRKRARHRQDRWAWRRGRTHVQDCARGLPGRRLATAACWKTPRSNTRSTCPTTGSPARSRCRPTSIRPRGRAARGPGGDAARARRLLRADVVEQLSQHARPQLPEADAAKPIRCSRSGPVSSCKRATRS